MKFRLFPLLMAMAIIVSGCETDDDHHVPQDVQINDFVWKGMNLYYLWQPEVSLLGDERFTNQSELNHFLRDYTNPVVLFEDLRTSSDIDRFSWIVDDYRLLEGTLSGTTKNNGVDYGLRYKPGSTTQIFGWVRYILPNSDAASKNIERGHIFYAVNGQSLTIDNYSQLLAADTYTLNLATYDNGNITPNGESVTLTKSVYSENPVFISNVIEQGQHRVGYIMYNGFYPNYETQLNNAFGELRAQNITHLVLDLRYNSGGSIATATKLASLITGQFTGQVFAQEQWNPKVQEYFEDVNPGTLRNYFGSQLSSGVTLNHLNLDKIYILTTESTASASELVINGLKPYINVIQIGTTTVGKNVGSITLYDSPSFSRDGRSDKHFYAMQPIVLKTINAAGFGDYFNGLPPDVTVPEHIGNLGTLGSPSETLLSAALDQISNNSRAISPRVEPTRYFTHSKSDDIRDGMYSEKHLME
ncbi:MAG: peptidase S41 [Flavobacterium sp.]|nr:peptidase S41 [Flavobacterium sp.]